MAAVRVSVPHMEVPIHTNITFILNKVSKRDFFCEILAIFQ